MSKLLDMLGAMRPDSENEPEAKPVPENETPDDGKLKPEGTYQKKGEEKSQEFDEVIRHTEKATLFGIHDRCFWLPKSKYRTEDNYVFLPDWMQLTLKTKGRTK